MEIPFFKKIDEDRQEVNNLMGRKYNLNFNAKDDNIFAVAPEVKEENEKGQRQNFTWIDITHETTNK